MNDRLQPGTRVKPSRYALRSSYDYMHQYLKGSSEYHKRKGWYNKEASKRGVILAINDNKWAKGYKVLFNGETMPHECIADMVEIDK